MTDKDFLILNKAYIILYRELGQRKYRCKSYAFGCMQCSFTRFLEDFKSIKNFILKRD